MTDTRVCWWLGCVEAAGVAAKAGGVVVYPTDTVYGIGSSPWSEVGVETVFRVKRRPPSKPVPLLLEEAETAGLIGEMSEEAWRLARRFWPGALTIIVPLRDTSIHPLVTGGGRCVGLRVPAHAAPRHLARLAGGAIIGTSANISGMPPKRSLDAVLLELGAEPIDYFLDGGVLGGTPSTVVNLCATPPRIERIGAIEPRAIRDVLGVELIVEHRG